MSTHQSSSIPGKIAHVFPTSTHEEVFRELYLCACAYFFPDAYPSVPDCPVKPRYNRLISGPTGVGKSHMAAQLAACLGAEFIKVDYGDWIPLGARTYPNSLARIASALLRSQRVVVLLDELDKMAGEKDATSWSISLQNEVYSLLERKISMEEVVDHLTNIGTATGLPTRVKLRVLEAAQQASLFVVACGTWQYARRQHTRTLRRAGFGLSCDIPPPEAEHFDAKSTIAQNALIPDELRCRFHSRILELRYPTCSETQALLSAWGFSQFVQDDPMGEARLQQLDLTQGGIRELESLYADLVMARMEPPDLATLLQVQRPNLERVIPPEGYEYDPAAVDPNDIPF